MLRKGFYEAILVRQNVQPSMTPIKVYSEAEDLVEATAWSGSTPQVLARLLFPRTSLELSLVLDENGLLSRTWLHEKPV